MSQKFSGTPFNQDGTSEIVMLTPNKPGPKPGAKAAAAAAQSSSIGTRQKMAQHSFTIDKSLIDYLFMRQEELAQKQIIDYDLFIRGMMAIASKPLSPNAPDTMWSNFLVQLISRTVNAGSKGVTPR